MLVKHSSANPNMAYVTRCKSMPTLNLSKYQIKSFGSTKPVGIIGDACDLPDENIEEHAHSANYNQDHTSAFDNEILRCELTETSRVSKSQHDRILRNPDSLEVDATSKPTTKVDYLATSMALKVK